MEDPGAGQWHSEKPKEGKDRRNVSNAQNWAAFFPFGASFNPRKNYKGLGPFFFFLVGESVWCYSSEN
jgi:hypothetical protein